MPIPFIHDNISIGGRFQNPDWINEVRHMHDSYELLFVLSGNIRVTNGSTSVIIAAPSLVMHRPFTLHRVERIGQDEPYHRYVYNFAKSLCQSMPDCPDPDRIFTRDMRVLQPDARLCERLSSMMELMSGKENEHIRRYLMAAVLSELAKTDGFSEPVLPAGQLSYISDVIRCLSDRFCETITPHELAEQYYISVSKLERDFKSATGMTIREMVWQMRIQLAKELLMQGELVADTAHRCGFVNESHFIRVFKRVCGTTPLRFRREQNEKKIPPLP
ncbi:MAG: AraC family transcriptional regulator [Ruminococcaceae bacterium]|nr:AraC family transcriptional regulator [Oscillospiraceae bacterium]